MVSACLIGIPCAYDGRSRISESLLEKPFFYDAIVAVCPEILGGQDVPRERAELIGGDGTEILSGRAKVIDKAGRDVSEIYVAGALRALDIVKRAGVSIAFLRERSPSCGVQEIYDGTFSGKTREGKGIFSALLEKEGIRLRGVKGFLNGSKRDNSSETA